VGAVEVASDMVSSPWGSSPSRLARLPARMFQGQIKLAPRFSSNRGAIQVGSFRSVAGSDAAGRDALAERFLGNPACLDDAGEIVLGDRDRG